MRSSAARWFGVLGAAVSLSAASPAGAGPVILGGDDLTHHGSYSGSVNQNGWLYIEKAIASLNADATRPGSVGIAVLGALPSIAACCNAGAAIGRAAFALGIPVTYYDGATLLTFFFSQLASASVNPRILWIAGTDAYNNLDPAEGAVLSANATAINAFVDSGGGLMAHGYGPVAYGWLSALLPGAIETPICMNPVTLTALGSAEFPGLTNANVDAGPCHSTFSGDLGGLGVLAVDVAGRAVIIGGSDVTIAGGCDGGVVTIDFESLAGLTNAPEHAEDGFRALPFDQFNIYPPLHAFYSGSTAVWGGFGTAFTRDNVNTYYEETPVARTPFNLLSVTLTEDDLPPNTMEFTGLQTGGTSSSFGYTLNGAIGPDPAILFGNGFNRTVHLEMVGWPQIDDIKICEPRCQQRPPGLVAWWAGDDCGAADGRTTNHGTLVGGSTCGGAVPYPTWRHRMVGTGSLVFASGNHVSVPSATQEVRNLSQDDFSIDAWVLIDTAFGELRPVIERGGNPGYKLSIGPSGGQTSLVLEVRDGSSVYYLRGATTVPLFDGYWHHVAVSYEEDPGDTTFYVDGQATTGLFLLLPLTLGNANQLLIGRDQGSVSFDGWIDELHLFERALDAAEIQSIYGAGTSGVCPVRTVIHFIDALLIGSGSLEVTLGPLASSASGSTSLQIATSPGQSPAQLAANLAAAINANAALQAEGIFAVVNADRVDIGGGVIHGASATDPDVSFVLDAPEQHEHVSVPLFGPGAAACLALLLTALGVRASRASMRRPR